MRTSPPAPLRTTLGWTFAFALASFTVGASLGAYYIPGWARPLAALTALAAIVCVVIPFYWHQQRLGTIARHDADPDPSYGEMAGQPALALLVFPTDMSAHLADVLGVTVTGPQAQGYHVVFTHDPRRLSDAEALQVLRLHTSRMANRVS